MANIKRKMDQYLPKELKKVIKKILFFGYKYKCPFCKSSLRKMKPYGINSDVLIKKNIIGGGFRKNAMCPVCLSIDRERLVYLYLKNRTDFFNKKK